MSADYSQMYPEILGKEKKIKKILVKKYGYKKENIHFRGRFMHDRQRYLRNAYWQPVEMQHLEKIGKKLSLTFKEISFFDDDCGYKSWYEWEKN